MLPRAGLGPLAEGPKGGDGRRPGDAQNEEGAGPPNHAYVRGRPFGRVFARPFGRVGGRSDVVLHVRSDDYVGNCWTINFDADSIVCTVSYGP